MPKNTSIDTHKTRKPHFRQPEKNLFFDFYQKSFIVQKQEHSARKTTFSQAQFRYESARVTFDQMKVSERRTKTEMRYFPLSIRKLISSTCQKKQRGHPQDSRKLFPLQKTSKTKKNSLLGKSYSAEKTKSGQLSQK